MPRPSKSVWIVTSVDETAGRFTVRPARGEQTDLARTFLEVEWRGARLPTIGTIVRSFIAIEHYDPSWKLAGWLRALRSRVSAASQMTLHRARGVLKDAHEDVARWLDGTWTATDLTTILQLFARAEGAASQAHWLYADDWRWSRELTSAAFARMLELPAAVQPRPPVDEEPLTAYAERCNEAAAARDCDKRLYLLGPRGDDHVFAALLPVELEILVHDGLVRPRG